MGVLENQLIPVSAVAEVLYCPRNFYYRMVEGAEDANHHVLEGGMQERMREERLQQSRDNVRQARRVKLASEQYGITGVLDMMEEKDGKRYPVEYKKGELRHNVNDDVQLCCQALLLEEEFGVDIGEGYIYYVESASRRFVPFSIELRELTRQTIEEARRILADGHIPDPVNDQRCSGCSLFACCLPEETVCLQGGDKPRRVVPTANLGRVLYIDSPGVYLRKREGRISVEKEKEVVQEVPLTSIDQVVMVGRVNATMPLLDELMRSGIPAYFCSTGGSLSGWLQPAWGKNSLLRIAQTRLFDRDEQKLTMAKAFVKGKLHNQRTLLMRYNRTIKSEALRRSCDFLLLCLRKIDEQQDLNQLMGMEGSGGRAYFEAIPLILKEGQDFFFAGRNRRPPRDPVNAMLSFGYALLTKDILSEIMRVGLDPYVGFLHSAVYGRPALALDVMEEFRPILVDSAVFTAINTGMVTADDFVMAEGSCQMSEAGRKALFQAYRNRVNEEITHPVFDYKLTYRRTIELQVRLLAKVIQGEFAEYISFQVR